MNKTENTFTEISPDFIAIAGDWAKEVLSKYASKNAAFCGWDEDNVNEMIECYQEKLEDDFSRYIASGAKQLPNNFTEGLNDYLANFGQSLAEVALLPMTPANVISEVTEWFNKTLGTYDLCYNFHNDMNEYCIYQD